MTEYTEEEIKRLKKYHPGCLRGEHVPVATVDKHYRILNVCCQNCLIPMTKEQHKAFFEADNRDWITEEQINYDEPGDPTDVDIYASTGEPIFH